MDVKRACQFIDIWRCNGLRESAIWRGALFLIAIDIVLGSFLWTLNLWDECIVVPSCQLVIFFKGGIFTTALRVALFAVASGAVGERRHAAPTFTKVGLFVRYTATQANFGSGLAFCR